MALPDSPRPDPAPTTAARLLGALDDLADAVLLVDGTGTVRAANRTASALFGDLTGGSLAEHVHPADRRMALDVLGAPVPEPVALRLTGADGAWQPCEVAVGRRSDGTVLLSVREVTARQRREAEAQAAADWLRALLRTVHDVVLVVGRDGTVRWAGGALTRLLGYDPVEIAERPWTDLVHADDADGARATFDVVAGRPGARYSFSARLRRWAGPSLRFELTASNLLDAPDVGAIVLTARDVTELTGARQRVRDVLDSVSIGTATADPDGRILSVNAAMSRLTGVAETHLVGVDLITLVGVDDLADVRAAWTALRERGSAAADLEVRWRNVVDASLWVALGLVPQHDAEGDLVQVTVLVEDLTARRHAGHGRVEPPAGSRGGPDDGVTSLSGKDRARHTLEAALARAGTAATQVGLLLCALDAPPRDDLVLAAADRLRRALRHGDTLVRVDDTVFAVIAEHLVGADDAEVLAQRLLSFVSLPFPVGEETVEVGAHVGIALGRGVAGADDLLAQAGLAVFRSRRDGPHGYAFPPDPT